MRVPPRAPEAVRVRQALQVGLVGGQPARARVRLPDLAVHRAEALARRRPRRRGWFRMGAALAATLLLLLSISTKMK